MPPTRSQSRALTGLLLLCAALPLAADAPAPPSLPILASRYDVADLGPLPHVADEVRLSLNDPGQAAGWADVGGGVLHPLLWTGGQPHDLGLPPGFRSGVARGLNKQGQAVGWASTGKNLGDSLATTRACLFSDGRAKELGTLGGRDSRAFGINGAGRIVGVSQISPQVRHAFLYANGKMTDLGTLPGGAFSLAYAVNEAGEVAGIADTPAHVTHAVVWRKGRIADLGTLAGGRQSLAYALNGRGEVAGAAEAGGDYHAAFVSGGRMTDLGTLGSDPAAVLGLNDRGQAVGASSLDTITRHGFTWERGKMTDLNRLLPDGAGWTVTEADAVNARGQIVAAGRRKGGPMHALLLTPHSDTRR